MNGRLYMTQAFLYGVKRGDGASSSGLYMFSENDRNVRVDLPAEGAEAPVRVALVTDLHACAYGEGQEELLAALAEQEPDLVLLGGDLFDDDRPFDRTVEFLRGNDVLIG